jgi:hypothetical protein
VWSSPPQNEIKLNEAFAEARNVLLMFSVKVGNTQWIRIDSMRIRIQHFS